MVASATIRNGQDENMPKTLYIIVIRTQVLVSKLSPFLLIIIPAGDDYLANRGITKQAGKI